MSQSYWDARFRERGRLWGEEPSLAGRRASELCRSRGEAIQTLGRPLQILLLGCGYGRNVESLAQGDCRVVALDASLIALALARPYPHVTYVCADATALPFRAAGFDAVVALDLLHLLEAEERRLLLDECRRVCRSGGALAISVFAIGDPDEGRGRCVEPGTWRREDGKRTHFFTHEELRDAVPTFTIRELETYEAADSSGLRRFLWLTATAP